MWVDGEGGGCLRVDIFGYSSSLHGLVLEEVTSRRRLEVIIQKEISYSLSLIQIGRKRSYSYLQTYLLLYQDDDQLNKLLLALLLFRLLKST